MIFILFIFSRLCFLLLLPIEVDALSIKKSSLVHKKFIDGDERTNETTNSGLRFPSSSEVSKNVLVGNFQDNPKISFGTDNRQEKQTLKSIFQYVHFSNTTLFCSSSRVHEIQLPTSVTKTDTGRLSPSYRWFSSRSERQHPKRVVESSFISKNPSSKKRRQQLFSNKHGKVTFRFLLDHSNYVSRQYKDRIMLNAPSGFDIYQGNLSDCFFIQTLAAIVHAQPQIIQQNIQSATTTSYRLKENSLVHNSQANFHYKVDFFHTKRFNKPMKRFSVQINDQILVHVNPTKNYRPRSAIPRECTSEINKGDLNKNSDLPDSAWIIWPLLYEKAYAMFLDHINCDSILFGNDLFNCRKGYGFLDHGGSSAWSAFHITGDESYHVLELDRLTSNDQLIRIFQKNGGSRSGCPLTVTTHAEFHSNEFYQPSQLELLTFIYPSIEMCLKPWHVLPVFGSDDHSVHLFCDQLNQVFVLPFLDLRMFVHSLVLRNHSDCVDDATVRSLFTRVPKF